MLESFTLACRLLVNFVISELSVENTLRLFQMMVASASEIVELIFMYSVVQDGSSSNNKGTA